MTADDPFRPLTAAYVLGALEPDERRALEAHLEGCDECRADVLAFSPVPALLGRVDPEDLDGAAGPSALAPDPSASVVAAARQDLRRLRTGVRRWRLLAAAATVVAVGALVAAALVPDGGARPARRGVALEVASEVGVEGAVVADERAWGTYVHVALSDLPIRERYELWVVDRSGRWSPAGSWAPTPEARADLGGSTELPLSEIGRLVVTSDDRDDLLATATATAPARPGGDEPSA